MKISRRWFSDDEIQKIFPNGKKRYVVKTGSRQGGWYFTSNKSDAKMYLREFEIGLRLAIAEVYRIHNEANFIDGALNGYRSTGWRGIRYNNVPASVVVHRVKNLVMDVIARLMRLKESLKQNHRSTFECECLIFRANSIKNQLI